METLTARRVLRLPDDVAALRGQRVLASAPSVDAPVRVLDPDTDEPIVIVDRCPEWLLGPLRQAMLAYPVTATGVLRSGGMHNRSGVFGFSARNQVLRREGCRACNGATVAAEAHQVIVQAAVTFSGMLAEHHPVQYAQDWALASEAILPDWRMRGTQWTSGVLNETSALDYHTDANNLPTWSAMVVVRRGVRGGYFHLPEYGLTLPCRDGDVVFAPAYRLLHGVTPMRQVTPDGYRYSAVYYTVARMAQCLEPEEELRYSQRTRSEREDNLLARQHASGLLGGMT